MSAQSSGHCHELGQVRDQNSAQVQGRLAAIKQDNLLQDFFITEFLMTCISSK